MSEKFLWSSIMGMKNMSVNQFVALVKEMRAAQVKFAAKHSYITPTVEDKQRMDLEKSVDKAIKDRERRLFADEEATQMTLF